MAKNLNAQWERLENLIIGYGPLVVLEALARQMSGDELKDALDYIAEADGLGADEGGDDEEAETPLYH